MSAMYQFTAALKRYGTLVHIFEYLFAKIDIILATELSYTYNA